MPHQNPVLAPYLEQQIQEALRETDPVVANLRITRCHYLLSQALEQVLGPGAGANFHTWAVWGSRKAGVTIRQQDLDQARRDGSIVGGVVGALVGVLSGWLLQFPPFGLPAAALLGTGCGIAVGQLIIRHSRRVSAQLILVGNRTVLEDIGTQTARFIGRFAPLTRPQPTDLDDFLAELHPGVAADNGQELLSQAFRQYFTAATTTDPALKQQATYLANCFAVWHEHVRLEPYIRGAMPLIIRRCVTERLLQFDIGPRRLAVAQDVPTGGSCLLTPAAPEQQQALARLTAVGGPIGQLASTAAHDWTQIQQRMRYVFALFHTFHTDTLVASAPYSPAQLTTIAAGQRPTGAL
ncbi:hypothetical protein [Hymenobacter chitinivorans]|uniref:Uncharacterized protein n=1 Tax=Hymenobacter chitinivorans DSM 11115 TaxID=1121954 RepID=A0A2M9BP91_9BACT|nr:hypothetical protein [Hymenobacter chitinivorans]PJJ59740.1 hypothetical protein CLV45_1162 [Hymenobacter chitinivorans DSM 11115]